MEEALSGVDERQSLGVDGRLSGNEAEDSKSSSFLTSTGTSSASDNRSVGMGDGGEEGTTDPAVG